MRRRRSAHLGEVEQRRVGGLRLDWAAIASLAGKIVRSFKPCGPADWGLVEPAATGQAFVLPGPRGVERGTVEVTPSTDTQRSIAGMAQKHWRPGGHVWTDVKLFPRATLCEKPQDWQRTIHNALAHELTHALSPYRPVTPQARARVRAQKPADKVPFCEYVNRHQEIGAFLNEVRDELRHYPPGALRRLGDWPLDKMLLLSQTWQDIKECYGPRARQRFYQMAARTLTRDAQGGWKVT